MDDASSSRRILIVDDAGLVRRFHRDVLEKAGFSVVEALNGVEALEKILAEPFDLAVVDVNMPQMDGVTFLAALRALDGIEGSLPALVVSTEAAAHDREAARAAGANFYLVKPVRPDILIEHVTLMCGGPR
ncbi:response regulator [Reyranella sp.]|uniref:response regulator n=1 Tax=Reyranella sp. TaxID=1929291 RepID=UPI003C7AEF22